MALEMEVCLHGNSQEDGLMSDLDGLPQGSPQLPMHQIDMTIPVAEFEWQPHLIPVSNVQRSPVTVPAVIPGASVGMCRVNHMAKMPVRPIARHSSASLASLSPSVKTVTNLVIGVSLIKS